MADENNNQKIDRAEIRKAITSFLLLAALAEQGLITADDIQHIAERSVEDGGDIAEDLIDRFDSDNSGDLDYNELNEDFSPPKHQMIRESLSKIGKIIPSFQLVALTLPKN